MSSCDESLNVAIAWQVTRPRHGRGRTDECVSKSATRLALEAQKAFGESWLFIREVHRKSSAHNTSLIANAYLFR